MCMRFPFGVTKRFGTRWMCWVHSTVDVLNATELLPFKFYVNVTSISHSNIVSQVSKPAPWTCEAGKRPRASKLSSPAIPSWHLKSWPLESLQKEPASLKCVTRGVWHVCTLMYTDLFHCWWLFRPSRRALPGCKKRVQGVKSKRWKLGALASWSLLGYRGSITAIL